MTRGKERQGVGKGPAVFTDGGSYFLYALLSVTLLKLELEKCNATVTPKEYLYLAVFEFKNCLEFRGLGIRIYLL